jgi:recombinational DNA repair protein RecR
MSWAKFRGYRLLASSEEVRHRLNVCEECPELTKQRDCRVCGCDVDAKTMIATERCPLKKWVAVWDRPAHC